MAHLQLLILSFVISCTVATKSNFYLEPECADKHGFCVLESECPHPVTAEFKGLCSRQQSQGAICCKDFPRHLLNCRQSNGACMDWCAKNLQLGRKDCPAGKMCCVLA